MTRFEGVRWKGFNNSEYGLGVTWPFPTDNCEQLAYAPSRAAVVVNPAFNGCTPGMGAVWTDLQSAREESVGFVEDSLGRLRSWSPAAALDSLSDGSWIQVPSTAALGNNLERDPERPGTVWGEVIRTDGSYRYSRDYTQFLELDPQSDGFTTVAPGAHGVAWLGSTQGLFVSMPITAATITSHRWTHRRNIRNPARGDSRWTPLIQRR